MKKVKILALIISLGLCCNVYAQNTINTIEKVSRFSDLLITKTFDLADEAMGGEVISGAKKVFDIDIKDEFSVKKVLSNLDEIKAQIKESIKIVSTGFEG